MFPASKVQPIPIIVLIVIPFLVFARSPKKQAALTVDTTREIGSISPYIYGSNEDDWQGSGRHLTFGRQGGNRMTAYNWENNASNAGNDYKNQSDDYLGGGNTPGEVPRKAVADAFAAHATILITIPMAGYVAADKNPPGDVNQTPDYLRVRFKKDVPRKDAPFSYPPDLNDDSVYQDEFVHWLERTFPVRTATSNIWYSLDNEPDLWSSTHSRIHPEPTGYAEIVQKSVAYASAIKAQAPKALVFGPASYGWNGYVNFQDAKDRNGRDFLDYYLGSMRQAEDQTGKRLLDVLDLHWYPEARGAGVRITEVNNTPAVAKARMQATRSYWDPTYVEDSWITQSIGNKPIELIPRIQAKIAKFYPGTKLAFTEYDPGGAADISGAIAEADTLGIFGREGVFAAAYWPSWEKEKPYLHAAFDAYRNYDGYGATFGDIALSATSSDPATVSIYASTFKTNPKRFVFVIVNQSGTTKTCPLSINAQLPPTDRQFTLAGNTPRLLPSQFANRTASGISLTLKPLSVNVLEMK